MSQDSSSSLSPGHNPLVYEELLKSYDLSMQWRDQVVKDPQFYYLFASRMHPIAKHVNLHGVPPTNIDSTPLFSDSELSSIIVLAYLGLGVTIYTGLLLDHKDGN